MAGQADGERGVFALDDFKVAGVNFDARARRALVGGEGMQAAVEGGCEVAVEERAADQDQPCGSAE